MDWSLLNGDFRLEVRRTEVFTVDVYVVGKNVKITAGNATRISKNSFRMDGNAVEFQSNF